MKTATAWSTIPDTDNAIRTAISQLEEKLGSRPDFLLLYSTVLYDSERLMQQIRDWAPDARLSGGTSCQGVMTEEGFHSQDGYGLGLMGFVDPDSHYGVGAAPLGVNPRAAARQAVESALQNAGRAGEPPSQILLLVAPGHEEAVIEGIQDIIGADIPINGGSSADNTVEGHWQQFANGEIYTDAVVVTALFPSRKVAYAFHSGYEPTATSGRVTLADGRSLICIDGQPAAEVYNAWTGGAITEVLQRGQGGSVLGLTTLHPIGRVAGETRRVPYYQLSHPNQVGADGSLSLFTCIEEGDTITLMAGTTDSLLTRAGRVAQAALESENLAPAQLAGAFVVYCAGCMLTVQNDMEQVVTELDKTLSDTPFLGVFTFGEQGCFVGGENCHGNLMISTVLWER